MIWFFKRGWHNVAWGIDRVWPWVPWECTILDSSPRWYWGNRRKGGNFCQSQASSRNSKQKNQTIQYTFCSLIPPWCHEAPNLFWCYCCIDEPCVGGRTSLFSRLLIVITWKFITNPSYKKSTITSRIP
jgi:hypothetical protein